MERGEVQELRFKTQDLQRENGWLQEQLAAYRRTLRGLLGGPLGSVATRSYSTPGTVGSLLSADLNVKSLTRCDQIGVRGYQSGCQRPQLGQQAMTPVEPPNAFTNPTVGNAVGSMFVFHADMILT